MEEEKKIEEFEKETLAYFQAHPRLRTKPKKLRQMMNVAQKDYAQFRDAVKNLAREGKLARFKGNMYGLSTADDLITGVLSIPDRKKMPYVTRADGERFTVDIERLKGAVQDDTVAVLPYPRKLRGAPDARVVKIIKRGRNRVLASYQVLRNREIAVPESKVVQQDILISDHNGFKPEPGDIIDVEILDWKGGGKLPEGRIIRRIGSRDSVEYDALLIADRFQIPTVFPHDVISSAERLELISDPAGRLDMRDVTTFTIDPADARDFDDALSIRPLKNNRFEIGVHIADVSAYVEKDSVIDKEAYKRGTSVYFTRQVIPMLPEKLSNELCSLNPDEDRLCLSVVFTMDSNAEVMKFDLKETIIHSDRRFSYEAVQDILDGAEGEYRDDLKNLNSLARKLYSRRHLEGSIDFDLPEARYELDDEGLPLNIFKKDRLDSHKLIEEFMLMANRSVTDLVLRKGRKEKIPFIFRIHEEPKSEDIQRLFTLMKSVGLQQKAPKANIRPTDIQKALESIADHPAEKFIEKITLRSMMKARYSHENAGHFGLAFDKYTHFTSPIRRYPDLIVHRILKKIARGLKSDYNEEQLEKIAKKSSETEVRAVEAEREYHKMKQFAYIRDKQGIEFDGTVSGVIQYGLFVELTDNFVEGFLHRRYLPGDQWEYDKEKYQLKGRYSRKIFRLGDPIKVKLTRIDEVKGDIDFELVE